MTARLVPDVLVVDPLDRELEQLLHACNMRAIRSSAAELTALAHASTQLPDVIVVDTRGARGLPSSLAAIKRQHPNIGILVVGSESDSSVLLEAMRAGANEFLQEPLNAAALEQGISRLLTHRNSTAATGEVFAFVGAKGGVGTTTAAVNVATALSKVAPSQILLADLHLTYGDAALLFGAEPRFSIVDALENTHRFDEAFFRGLVTPTKSGPELLASSDRALLPYGDVQRFRSVIEFSAQLYRYVVLDVPRADGAALEALGSASQIIVVANQELAAARSASRLAAALRQRYGRERVQVIVSRVDKHAEITQADIEKVVGSKIEHMLPSDYRLALDALNRGRPLALHNHNALAAGFRGLARSLAKIGPEPQRKESGGGFFGRLTGRG
jgi:pilus assembly protein CpaE